MKKLINLILSMCSIIVLFCITFTYSKTHACTDDDFYNTNIINISNETKDNINLAYLPENAPDGNSSFKEAKTIEAGNVYTFNFQNESDIDYYYFSPKYINYFSIVPSKNEFDVTLYSKEQKYIEFISYEELSENKTLYLTDPIYIVLSSNGYNGNYSFSIKENNTYDGVSYTSVMSEKTFYGVKRAKLQKITYFKVYIDTTMSQGYSSVAGNSTYTLYEDAIKEIYKLGFIRFKEVKESEANIKIYYKDTDPNGDKLSDNLLGVTTYKCGYKKVKSSTIVYNSSRFNGNSTINFMKYSDALNVVIHELLHSIGLDHTQSSNTSANVSNVMYYSNTQYEKFGAFDIASYRKLWG